MIEIGDKVIIHKQGYTGYIGKGQVIVICESQDELINHFKTSHPYYDTYSSWIKNHKPIYIVELEGNIGRAGFLQKELTVAK